MLYIHLLFSVLTSFISSFRIKFTIICDATIATCMSYYRDCSSSSSTKNNKTRGQPWSCPTASDTPSEMDLDEVGGNQSQSGTPHGMIHSDRASSNNSITSAGNHLGMNLSNGSPTLGNLTSANQTEMDNVLWQTNT